MRTYALIVSILLCCSAASSPLAAPAAAPSLAAALRADLTSYLSARGSVEHISTASLSISFSAATPNLDVAVGTTTFGGSTPVTPSSLFQIGSNTKSFAAATILELEAQGVLSINDRVGKWLPEYPAWKNITIAHLLNMTSGIPTYDANASMLSAYSADPYRFFSTQDLIAYVYPKTEFAPGKGWLYSNTAYLMAQMIVEKATGHDYAVDLASRFFNGGPQLADTYYRADVYPGPILRRMVAGYFSSHDPDNAGLAPLLGRDVRDFSVSWMQGAGGIVATPHALTHWVRALYESPMLASAQRRELLTIVSNATGAPIARTSLSDSRGFGLGVGQLTLPRLGTIWFYEGETLGYRVAYAYFPKSGLVIALGLNSQPDAKQDKIGALVESVYQTLHTYGKT